MTGWLEEKDTKDHLESFWDEKDGWNWKNIQILTSQGITPPLRQAEKEFRELYIFKTEIDNLPLSFSLRMFEDFWSNLRTLPSWNFHRLLYSEQD